MADLLENNLGLQVLTDTGWSNFEGLLDKGLKQIALLQLTNTSIKATLDHKIYTNKFDMIPVSQLRVGTQIYTASGLQKLFDTFRIASEWNDDEVKEYGELLDQRKQELEAAKK